MTPTDNSIPVNLSVDPEDAGDIIKQLDRRQCRNGRKSPPPASVKRRPAKKRATAKKAAKPASKSAPKLRSQMKRVDAGFADFLDREAAARTKETGIRHTATDITRIILSDWNRK